MTDTKISGQTELATVSGNERIPCAEPDGLGDYLARYFLASTLATYMATLFQALDGDLTAIAALAPTNDDIIQRKAGAWTNRTMAQLRADLGSMQVYSHNAVGVSHTGDTNETTLRSINMSAGVPGINGLVVIQTLWSFTGTNTKTSRVKAGGTTFTSINNTTNLSGRFHTTIENRNAANSQIAAGTGNTGFISNSVACVTSAFDTASAWTIDLTGQLTNTGESITLESYTVFVFQQA